MDAPGLRPPPAMGARPHTHIYTHIYTHICAYSARNAPATRTHTPTLKHTLRCPHSTDSAHTQPQAGGRRYSPSATLTAQSRPAPLTWAERRRAGSRRLAGGRAGGAPASPSYGTGRARSEPRELSLRPPT